MRIRLGAALVFLVSLSRLMTGHYVEATLPVGQGPVALCFNPRDCKVYCASEVDRSVTIIDGARNRIVKRLQVSYGPKDMCYDSTDNRVYLACWDAMQVWVIDGAADSVITAINVLYHAYALCYNPDSGRICCAAQSDGVTIDCRSNTLRSLFNVVDGAVDVCYVAARQKYYFTGSDSSCVTVVDAVADTVLRTVRVGDGPAALCSSAESNLVCCANRGGTLSIINVMTDSVLSTTAVGARFYDVCYSSRRNVVYCAVLDSNAVKVVDALSGSVLSSVPAGNWPWALCYAPETNELYCADNLGNTVAVIDASVDTLMHLVSVGRKPTALAWNPTWHRMYVANYDNATVSVIRDSLVGLEEASPEVGNRPSMATVTGGTLLLRGSNSAALIDISGRTMADLKPGRNRIEHLRRGIYFVRSLSTPETCKVTILN
jgi:DNA-binding beta-propeller fold protein YncE